MDEGRFVDPLFFDLSIDRIHNFACLIAEFFLSIYLSDCLEGRIHSDFVFVTFMED